MQQPNSDIYQDDHYDQLLDYIKTLFKRQNLCNNTYLYKKMNGRLSVPLYVIAQQRNVSRITRDSAVIIDAIENSGLAHVVNNKEVKLIEYPTVKISIMSHEGLRQIEKILQQKVKKYEISKRLDTEQYINLTVFGENIVWLDKLLQNVDKQIDYQKVSLMDDIKIGVDRIRKLKFDHAKLKTTTGIAKYSLENPPKLFVRKALQDSDSSSGEEVQVSSNRNGQIKKYRLNSKPGVKPRLQNEDFPQLK